MKKLSLITLLCLAACGGKHQEVVKTPDVPPQVKLDSFYTEINLIVGDAVETTNEPVDVANVTMTEPEDTEPVALTVTTS